MKKEIINKLIEFGLSDKEASIYTSLLELEIASVSEIANQTGINRTSAYVVLESLKKKGLVGVSEDKKIQKYVASPPDILLRTARETAEKQQKVKESIESIVPELKSLHKETKHKPIVKVFEGKEAVRQIYLSDYQRPYPYSNETRVYENPETYKDILSDFIRTDYEIRKSKGIKMYAMFPDTKESYEVLKEYETLKSKDEVALIPKSKFISAEKFTTLTICGDEVWFDSLKENYCISIKKQEIADTLKNIFDLAWAEAKKFKKRKAASRASSN